MNQWCRTKMVGEIFLWYKYPCYVNDISRNHCWDNSVVQVIKVIQVIQLIQVMQIRLAHLWPDFRVINFFWISCDYKILVLILSWAYFFKRKMSLKLFQFKYSMGFPNIFKILWRRNFHWNMYILIIRWGS